MKFGIRNIPFVYPDGRGHIWEDTKTHIQRAEYTQSFSLELTRSALQANETFRTPHLNRSTAIFHGKQNLAEVQAREHLAFDDDIASPIAIAPKYQFMISDAILSQPLDGLRPILLPAASAYKNLDSGFIQDITQSKITISSTIVRSFDLYHIVRRHIIKRYVHRIPALSIVGEGS